MIRDVRAPRTRSISLREHVCAFRPCCVNRQSAHNFLSVGELVHAVRSWERPHDSNTAEDDIAAAKSFVDQGIVV